MHILYLHGVGIGDPATSWFDGLNSGLTAIGAEPVELADVTAPRYRDLLQTPGIESTHPPVTEDGAADSDARRAFERRQGQVELLVREFAEVRAFGLGRVPDSVVNGVQESLINAAPVDVLKQVKNYLTDVGLRGAVLSRILEEIPDVREVIVIGHSLGSVIAIDLLDHLPVDMRVRRFITVGSPAGTPVLYKNSEQILAHFPYARVDDWSNFLDPLDGVTAGRGLATIFPGAQDFLVRGASSHRSYDYLSHPAIATLIDRARRPEESGRVGGDLVRALTDAELTALVTLQFAEAVGEHIAKKPRDVRGRYRDAVSLVRERYVADLVENGDQRLPPELAALTQGRLPRPPRVWDLAETVSRTVVLAYSNVIAPYEINTGDAPIAAMATVIRTLGHSAEIAEQACAAVESVNAHLEKRSSSLLGTRSRRALAAAGVALLAAGPLGLAVAGGVGVVGAAALSGGFAAVSTAGMAAGGLAVLGGLAGTAGMVAAAAATARPGPQAVVLDPTSVAIQVAIAHALKNVGEEFDAQLWERVTMAESELSAQINRLEPFSDSKAPGLAQLRADRDAISSLLGYLTKHALVPDEACALELD